MTGDEYKGGNAGECLAGCLAHGKRPAHGHGQLSVSGGRAGARQARVGSAP